LPASVTAEPGVRRRRERSRRRSVGGRRKINVRLSVAATNE